MSSLLQHTGRCDRSKGVELFFYLTHEERYYPSDDTNVWQQYGCYGERCDISTHKVDSEPQRLFWNDSYHIVPKLYRIWRKPCGMFGCWVQFRINGAVQVPDLSCPFDLPKLPRDAVALTDEEAIAVWKS